MKFFEKIKSLVGGPKKEKPIREESKLKEYSKAIGSALLIAMVLKTLAFQAFTIPTGSMLETLQIGDFLFVEKFTYGPRTPERIRLLGNTLVKGLPTLKIPGYSRYNGYLTKYPTSAGLL